MNNGTTQPEVPDIVVFQAKRSGYVVELDGAYLGFAQEAGMVEFGDLRGAQFFTEEEVAHNRVPSALASPGTKLQSALIRAAFKRVEVVTYYKVEK